MTHILTHDIGENNINAIKEFFLITGNAERIGDHAANIGGYLNTIMRQNIVFSDIARQELTEMSAIVKAAMDKLLNRQGDATEWLSELSAAEQQIDDLTRLYREQHLNRMHRGLCSEEACILYSELLTDFERIGDHILNIAQAFAKIQTAN